MSRLEMLPQRDP